MCSCWCCLSASAILSSSGALYSPAVKSYNHPLLFPSACLYNLVSCCFEKDRLENSVVNKKVGAAHQTFHWTPFQSDHFLCGISTVCINKWATGCALWLDLLLSLSPSLSFRVCVFYRDRGVCRNSCSRQDVVNLSFLFHSNLQTCNLHLQYTTDMQLMWFVVCVPSKGSFKLNRLSKGQFSYF